MSPRLFLCLILLGAACGGGSSDDTPDGTPGADAIPGVDAPPIDLDPTPILERAPVADPATCTGPATATTLGSGWYGTTLVEHGDALEVAYIAASGASRVGVNALTIDPALALGAERYGREGGLWGGQLAVASKANATAIASAGTGAEGTALELVVVDDAGTPLAPPRTIEGISLSYGQEVAIAALPDGWLLAWVAGPFDGSRLMTRRLAEDGAPVGDAVDLAAATTIGDVIAREGGGVIVGFSRGTYGEGEAYVLLLDDLGLATGTPQPVSPVHANMISYGAPTLLERDGGWLAAYVETYYDYNTSNPDQSESWDTIQLVALNGDGQRTGTTHRLIAPVIDTSITSPRLAAVGDRIGLAWSAGTIIYICAGCMPDHVMRFVLLDADTMVPASNIVEVAGTSGLFTSGLRAVGTSIVGIFSVVYHVSADGAGALLSCE